MNSKIPRGVFERPKDSGVWWINYYDDAGLRHREKIGRLSVAVEAYFQRRIELRESKFVAPRKRAHVTFRELAEARMEYKRPRLAPLSYRADDNRIKPLLEKFGELRVEELTPEKISAALDALILDGIKPSTANRYRTLLSSIFAHGVTTGKVKVNPIERVERYKESVGRIRFLAEDEEKRLRKAIRKMFPGNEPELDIAINTGARRSEQYDLRWNDLDLDRLVVTVNGKGDVIRHIPLNSAAVAAFEKLRKRSRGSEFICPEREAPRRRRKANRDPYDNRKWFPQCVKAAAIAGITWHGLRHTFASRLVMRGVDLKTVQELLGHKSIAVTMRYAHLSRSHKHAAVDRLVEGHSNGTKAKRSVVRFPVSA